MKKSIILIILSVQIFSSLCSQTTFNKEIWPMKFISVSGPILIKEDTIVCLGHGTDYYAYQKYAAYLAKYNMEGNYLTRYIDTIGDYYYTWATDAYWDKDNIITFVGNNELDYTGGYFLIIDSNNGKFIKKKKIHFENDPNRSLGAKGLAKIDSFHYAALSSSPSNGIYSNLNIIVSIINTKTDKVKHIEIEKDTTNDIPEFIKWNGKKLLVGSNKPVTHWSPDLHEYTLSHSGNIYEIDTSGTWKDSFVADFASGGIKNILINIDKEYICTSFRIKYNYYNNERKFRWRHNVMKLDSNYNKIWEKPWGLGFDYNYEFGFAGILEAEEGDGYILCGYQPNYPWTKEGYGYWYLPDEVVDSMKKAGDIPKTVGILQKINEDGDSIWLRSYSYVNDTSLNFVWHYMKTLIPSPDGGYIMYGHILHSPRPGIDTANQYPAWLVKVDKYGCLVPGCQDTTDTTATVDILPDIDVRLYPNPTSDRLLVYQHQAGITKYAITDISGRLLRHWSGNLGSHTYIVDVSGFTSGVYILTVEKDGVRRGKKFVVER